MHAPSPHSPHRTIWKYLIKLQFNVYFNYGGFVHSSNTSLFMVVFSFSHNLLFSQELYIAMFLYLVHLCPYSNTSIRFPNKRSFGSFWRYHVGAYVSQMLLQMCMHKWAMVLLGRSKDNFWEPVISFQLVSSGDWTRVLRHGSENFNPLSHGADPIFVDKYSVTLWPRWLCAKISVDA